MLCTRGIRKVIGKQRKRDSAKLRQGQAEPGKPRKGQGDQREAEPRKGQVQPATRGGDPVYSCRGTTAADIRRLLGLPPLPLPPVTCPAGTAPAR